MGNLKITTNPGRKAKIESAFKAHRYMNWTDTVPDPENEGETIPNPISIWEYYENWVEDQTKKIFKEYLEWKREDENPITEL